MKQTTLDLNGPILSFTSHPVGVASTGIISGTGSGIATFTGIATAAFTTGVSTGSPSAPTNPATNTGIITYRWYEVGVGALSDSTYVTGTGTTTLTLTRLISPNDNQREFYLTADYLPSAYQSTSPVTAGTARSTGNAINEPISSEVGTLTVYPLLEIVSQPTSSSAILNNNTTFSINASLTDDFFANDLTYQWYWDGVAVDDGTITTYQTTTTTTTTTNYRTENETVYEDRTSTISRSETRTFTSPGSITLPPSSTDVQVRVAGGGGGRGGSDATASGGDGAQGRFGRFFYNSGGRTLTFTIGKKGNDGASNAQNGGGGAGGEGYTRGGRGGNAGSVGASGGGGGGGGSTAVYDSVAGYVTLIASGGGGGGGASRNVPGAPAQPVGGGFSPNGRNIENGNDGESVPSGRDGGGGGGGGAGTNNSPAPSGDTIKPKQLGGRSGLDDDKGNVQALGGGNGRQIDEGTGYGRTGAASFGGFDRGYMTFPFDGSGNSGDGYAQVSYNYTETVTTRVAVGTRQITVPDGTTTITTTTSVPRNTTLSGTRTPTLTVRSDAVGINTVRCLVSSATAANSFIFSDEVNFNSVSNADQYKVKIESINTNSGTGGISEIDLFNGSYEFSLSTGTSQNEFYSIYAPDRDIAVEMDLYGGKGINVGSYSGGEGGFSRIRFTMTRNTEYVIAGLISSINTPFIYRKGQLIACVGGGGNAGTSGRGGAGGGVSIGGADGTGRSSGLGGAVVSAGNLDANGVFGSLTTSIAISPDSKAVAPNGGRAIKCTKGVYWQQQGVSACSDVGTTQFRLSNGTVVANTGSITRGFKAGYGIIETAGAGTNAGGNGGNGVRGGNGGQGGAGGGGGSGYTDGSITIITNTLGGSTGNARVVLRRVG